LSTRAGFRSGLLRRVCRFAGIDRRRGLHRVGKPCAAEPLSRG
jgi:hypothetical protein